MNKITLRMCVCAVVFLTAFVGVSVVSAAVHPKISELYGRYVFDGKMTSLAEQSGEEALEPVARNGYEMVVVPGAGENEVQVLGFFGYGGGLTATYSEEEGVLHCRQVAFFACANVSYGNGGMMVVADAGQGNTFDLHFNVSDEEGNLVITAAESLQFTAMSGSMEGDKWTYEAGYTLTKRNMNVSQDKAVGKYEFESSMVVNTALEDVWEFFDLSVVSKGEGKVTLSGLFDLADEIDADYYAEGGIIMLPVDYTFANGLYMGNYEGTPENYYGDAVMRQEAAPYLLVDGEKVTSPSSFVVNGKYDDVTGFTRSFSFIGGEGKKVPGSSVAHVSSGKGVEVLAGESALSVKTSVAGMIQLYDIQGALVGEKTGTSVRFDGLSAGVYVVKVAGQAVKVIVK